MPVELAEKLSALARNILETVAAIKFFDERVSDGYSADIGETSG